MLHGIPDNSACTDPNHVRLHFAWRSRAIAPGMEGGGPKSHVLPILLPLNDL
jgi:hypothetical protein